MKKITLGTLSLATLISPILATVACGSDDSALPATQDTTTLKLNSNDYLVNTSTFMDSKYKGMDVKREDFQQEIIDANITEIQTIVTKLQNANVGDNLALEITYKDASITFYINVYQISPLVIVTIDQIKLVHSDKSLVVDESMPKIKNLRKYAKGFIETMIKIAKDNNLDLAVVKDAVYKEMGIIKNSVFLGNELMKATSYIYENQIGSPKVSGLLYSYYLSAVDFNLVFTLFKSTTASIADYDYYTFGITTDVQTAPNGYQIENLASNQLYVQFLTLRGDVIKLIPLEELP